MKAAVQAARILRKEGLSGIVGRLRHPKSAPPPDPPDLRRGAQIVGNPAGLAGLFARLMPEQGNSSHTGAACRIVVGLTAERLMGLSRHDILVMDRTPDAGLFDAALDCVGMIVDFDPARIAAMTKRPRGFPHLMVIAPPPAPGASPEEWEAYARRADFGLRRVLLMTGGISPEALDYGPSLTLSAECAISLPETPERRQAFMDGGPKGLPIIDGLRAHPGWVGAGLTYRQLARGSLGLGQNNLLVAQDDATPGPDFERRLSVARHYLQASGAAMFAGLVTDVDDSFRVLRVREVEGVTFVHLNKSVGLVFNIFGERMLQHIARWSPSTGKDGPVTIDRHISHCPDVEIVTCLPFLVGHHDEQRSSVWDFNSGRYNSLIRASERRLTKMTRLAKLKA